MRVTSALSVVLLLWPLAVAGGEPTSKRHNPKAVAEYERGTELARHGDHMGAIDAYEAALQVEPDWPEPRNDLGVELYLTGAPQRAAAHLRAVLAADPSRGAAHTNLGFALYDLGQVDQAVAEWRAALEQGARVADTYAGLALGLYKQGKTEEALRMYRLAIERDQQYRRLEHLQSGAAGWSRHAADDIAPLLRALQPDP